MINNGNWNSKFHCVMTIMTFNNGKGVTDNTMHD